MRESNTQVIYLDETVFTFSTFRAKGWAHNRDRIRINDSNLRVTTLAVIAAISEEGMAAARSQIEDYDYAQGVADKTAAQIRQSVSASLVGQSSRLNGQVALSLLS